MMSVIYTYVQVFGIKLGNITFLVTPTTKFILIYQATHTRRDSSHTYVGFYETKHYVRDLSSVSSSCINLNCSAYLRLYIINYNEQIITLSMDFIFLYLLEKDLEYTIKAVGGTILVTPAYVSTFRIKLNNLASRQWTSAKNKYKMTIVRPMYESVWKCGRYISFTVHVFVSCYC